LQRQPKVERACVGRALLAAELLMRASLRREPCEAFEPAGVPFPVTRVGGVGEGIVVVPGITASPPRPYLCGTGSSATLSHHGGTGNRGFEACRLRDYSGLPLDVECVRVPRPRRLAAAVKGVGERRRAPSGGFVAAGLS
jgi:hypothetical protein